MNEKLTQSVTVLRNILNDETFFAFIKYAEDGREHFAQFINKIMSSKCETDFLGYVQTLILTDENAFSVCCASGEEPSKYLENAFLNDLNLIFDKVIKTETCGYFNIGAPSAPFDLNFNHENSVKNLKAFYGRKGYGMFINNRAFIYEENELKPVETLSDISLSQLKDYEYEKKLIQSNIENFLNGLPYSDLLLYGDMGTGKSSTVHAMLNTYFDSGLRIIELNKENMLQIPKIRQHIKTNKLKFIIFIDDLSLDENDDKISSLKASLEGSLTCGAANTMIVATSNRRHIVKETFIDREHSVHANDSIQEQLSLSDRFGLTVMFSSTDKTQYLSIVKQLANDKKLKYDETELCSIAERWALIKGGRSPRRAKQIVDLVYSCHIKGIQVDF